MMISTPMFYHNYVLWSSYDLETPRHIYTVRRAADAKVIYEDTDFKTAEAVLLSLEKDHG